ncbi:effector-associated constant component EACC1 [Streptomyces sp. NPDC054847]
MNDLTVRVTATGDGEDALRSLLRWVHEDENLDGRARGRIGAASAPEPGSMGSGFDLVQFAVASGLSTSALVVSVLQWRSSLRRPPAVTLSRDGVEIRLAKEAADDPETLGRIMAALEKRNDDGAR